jgi:hypothetical protein
MRVIAKHLSLHDSFKSDIAIVLMGKLQTAVHALSVSNMYHISTVASCFYVNPI